MISMESAPCEMLDLGGACWATLVAAAGASARPRATPGGYGKKRDESSVGGRNIFSTAGTAIVGGGGGSYTTDESPRRIREVVNPHTGPVCAKIANIGRGGREPTSNNALGVGYQPTQTNIGDRRGTGAEPAGPDEDDTAIVRREEAARPNLVVVRGRLLLTGQEIDISVGAALAVLEGVVKRGR